ncbi:MAG: hypothetical protein HOW73_36570 [Polyangiaceae bacterium]|nr:hypothetical protein [Polyangiaceae bacterium]
MHRRTHAAPCAVCRQELTSSKLSRVVVEAKTVLLCRDHAAVVARNMPRTFEELRRLFLEESDSAHPARRSVLERRVAEDRRIFPPRPEGRRLGGGRRASDAAV